MAATLQGPYLANFGLFWGRPAKPLQKNKKQDVQNSGTRS